MKLYKLHITMHRSAALMEVAAVTDDEWRTIQEHANAELYFGEVAGKHSEVRWTLDPKALEVLTENRDEIALFKRWFPMGSVGQVSILRAIERVHDGMEPGDEDCMCGEKAPAKEPA